MKPVELLGGRVTILQGDVRVVMPRIESESVDCVPFSPPYWGLRDYGFASQIGLEPTLGEHIEVMVDLMREVWRVLKPGGTVWLNYGDCYAASPNGRSAADTKAKGNDDRSFRDKPFSTIGPIYDPSGGKKGGGYRGNNKGNIAAPSGRVVAGGFLKSKDLCMIPNRLAIALQDDGWYVRSEIVWHKLNPMPESIRDRPTVAHEKIFLLTKSEHYWYDAEAIRESVTGNAHPRAGKNSRENFDRGPVSKKAVPAVGGWDDASGQGRHGSINHRPRVKGNGTFSKRTPVLVESRNARNVWSLASSPYPDAHFATFPPEIPARCIAAGCPPGGMVLDPFAGSGTVGKVAAALGRRAILIEGKGEYVEMARRRIEARNGV